MGGDPGGDDDRSRDHPAAHAALHVGGVGEDVGEGDVAERSGAELGQLLVEAGTDRLTSDLEIPDAAPRALTRSSTFLVETPCT